jgi:hypothetical protein
METQTMTLVGRWILLIAGTAVAILAAIIITFIVSFLAGEGTIHYNSKEPGCYHDRRFYGDSITVYEWHGFEWHVHSYGCPASDQYDPSTVKSL